MLPDGVFGEPVTVFIGDTNINCPNSTSFIFVPDGTSFVHEFGWWNIWNNETLISFAAVPPVCPVKPRGAAVAPAGAVIPASLGWCAVAPSSFLYQRPPPS